MAKRTTPYGRVSADQIPQKRESKYFFPGRQVWHKKLKKLGKIISAQDASIHEYWMVKFDDGETRLCLEKKIVPFDYRNCFCGEPLSVEYEDCPNCRWFICAKCGRCRCRGRGEAYVKRQNRISAGTDPFRT